ncbi:MAG TPA: lipid II flippase MurJ, partial [Candidatus Saccharimonadales bacterium]|nr:lipid II flippase MurJ [Candidatus Saccharimonadales bacterium]
MSQDASSTPDLLESPGTLPGAIPAAGPGAPGGPAPAAGGDSRLARSAGQVSVATFMSRILGLIREQVLAALFGAGLATDAFNVAFRIPNLLRDLFAEGDVEGVGGQ